MSVSIHIDDLVKYNMTTGRPFWAYVLLEAIRDNASSVHYHPWLGDQALSRLVANESCVLTPPPLEWAETIVAAARSLLAPYRLSMWGGRRTLSGQFKLRFENHSVDWAGVIWCAGSVNGVELFRLSDREDDSTST